MLTHRIKLGTMLTPVSRWRPWQLAGQTATLDNLSCGRVILGVGLGALDTGFAEFGEVTDRGTRAELMNEGLEIITGLWKGQPFSYAGKHYHIQPLIFPQLPPFSVQRDNLSIVIRPLATSIPTTTWLNWRNVVFPKRGAMVCKNATISVMGFSGLLGLW